MVLWFTFSYAPIAHMVWFWMGPDAYTGKEVVDAMNAKAGLIWQWGALDFAGGTVVHINAAVAGLVGAYMIGKRIGYGKEAFTPHYADADDGRCLAAVGRLVRLQRRLGARSRQHAPRSPSSNTFSATAAAVLAWCIGEALFKGKASMLGAASGAVAGLVAITPACRQRRPRWARSSIGFVAGFACLWGVTGLKKHARRRRLARRVRRARRRRHRRRAADRRVQHTRRSAARAWSTDWVTAHGRQSAASVAPGLDPAQGRAA